MAKIGYIKLYRSSTENDLYFAEPFTKWQAWVDLLMLANHKKRVVSIRGNMVTVLPGQVLAGERFLSERWKWSRGKVRRFMEYLSSETVHQIEPQKNNVCSLYSIVNWCEYQNSDTTDSTTDGPQTVPQTDRRQTTPKNVKKDKNDKNDKNAPPPTLNPLDEEKGGGGECEKPEFLDMAQHDVLVDIWKTGKLNPTRFPAQSWAETLSRFPEFDCGNKAHTGFLMVSVRAVEDSRIGAPANWFGNKIPLCIKAEGKGSGKKNWYQLKQQIDLKEERITRLFQKHYFQSDVKRIENPEAWEEYLKLQAEIKEMKGALENCD
jgi:hypothetical protein